MTVTAQSDDVLLEKAVTRLSNTLHSYKFDLSDEKRLQQDIEAVLNAENYNFKREFYLDQHDIPDFLIDDAIVVECKLKGQKKKSIYKQLCRYAKHPSVKALILVTNVSMGLPEEIEGKPAYYLSLSCGWM